MRVVLIAMGALVAGAWLLPAAAQTRPGPGAAAQDAITSPTRPPAEVAPARPAGEAGARSMPTSELRELIDAAQATAKATREAVDYNRVTPDLLNQILVKLDKIETKLDKVEAAVKAGARRH